MSVTGESYIDSAKSAISLILGNFSLYVVVDVIGSLVSFCVGLSIILIPSLIGFVIIHVTQEKEVI